MIAVYYTWDGEAMRPIARFHNVCNSQFVVGQEYKLEVVQVPDERSEAEHKDADRLRNALPVVGLNRQG